MYADPAFVALAQWCRRLVDDLAERTGSEMRDRMREAFLTSVRYELAFWDMAWKGDRGQESEVGARKSDEGAG